MTHVVQFVAPECCPAMRGGRSAGSGAGNGDNELPGSSGPQGSTVFLNRSRTVGDTLAEPLIAQGGDTRAVRERIDDLLTRVRLPADSAPRLPREFSSGQRQRLAVAHTLALRPRLIVCDEPVSALDPPTRRTVLDLLLEIQQDTGVSYLFISHDLAVVRCMGHRVVVIHQGRIVATGEAARVTGTPEHPCTRTLLLSSPVADVAERRRRGSATGRPRTDSLPWTVRGPGRFSSAATTARRRPVAKPPTGWRRAGRA
ncbi:ATP-binding cassette domain-containing protein [Streptomyces sp. NPDC101151]|uniref:ATP-binding cassette domain-containing protein n=1 Tax=Streptomyces sp. NPDC101151 TaxID=3366115 RepID=UPI00380C51CF